MILLLKKSVDGIHLNIKAVEVKVILSLVDNGVDRVNSLIIGKESINSLIVSVDDWDPRVSEVIEAVTIGASLTEGILESLTINLGKLAEVVARVPIIIVMLLALLLFPEVRLFVVDPLGA